MPAKKNRIAIVTIISSLEAFPSLMNAIRLLAGSGYQVDVIGRRSPQWKIPKFEHLNVNLIMSPWSTRVGGIPGLAALRHLLLIMYQCIFFRPQAVFAISPEALVLVAPIAILLRIPLVHYSLEIRYARNWISWLQKQAEKFYYHFVRFTIIQDEIRGWALLDSNNMKKAEMIYVPNSTSLSKPNGMKSDYLRRYQNIPCDNVIILSAGCMNPTTLTYELAKDAQTWPINWTLVLHGWVEDQDYLDDLRTLCDGKRIILSTEFLSFDQVNELVSSADIGVALYKATDPNVLNMSRSSGKIWQYLFCGLPVVTVDFPTLQQMVDEGKFGLCIARVEDIRPAIVQILADYAGFASQAQDFYRRNGDFSTSFKPVLERLASLTAG